MENLQELSNIIKKGGIGVIPTDTLYGIVGSALDRNVVQRIYDLKERDTEKPFIVLISSFGDLRLFGIELEEDEKKLLLKFWPGKASIILRCENPKLKYLHRGANSIAFRIPDKSDLIELLKMSGPLVAPSANPQGKDPARNIEEAKKYFGGKADFYLDGGELDSPPSALIEIADGEIKVLRKGISLI